MDTLTLLSLFDATLLVVGGVSTYEILAAIGVTLWVGALAWLVFADAIHAWLHSRWHHHHGSGHGPAPRQH